MIEVENLRFAYDGVEAVRGVSFRVRPGEICGYLGPNGAGKSTTVKAIVGILRAQSGTIRVAGWDVAESPIEAKRQVGYMPENAAAFNLLTPAEYLELVGALYEMEEAVVTERTARLIGNLGLEECASRRIDTLSKGQRQKAVLAAALIHDPKVLILDEPLTGLDANAARVVKDVVVGLAAQGRTVLFCSHVLEVVERICHRVVVLHQGQVVADAMTRDLLASAQGRNLDSVFRQLTMDREDDAAQRVIEALGSGATAEPPARGRRK
jgi:ABC-2 type transport system ATP-binding protein